MPFKLGDEIIHDGVVYVLIDSTPIRRMTGNSGGVCTMCQGLGRFCKSPFSNNRAYDMCCHIAEAVFVKKLEV